MARKSIREKYTQQHAKIVALPACDRPLQVVIPALAEADELPAMLDSLTRLRRPELARFTFVINHGPEARPETVDSNMRSRDIIDDFKRNCGTDLKIEVIAQFGDEFFARQKKCGVGLARRVGLDSALASSSLNEQELTLVCLDADTWVNPDYLDSIFRWSQHDDASAASIPFAHRLPEPSNATHRAAIVTYELFLRYYVGGLRAISHPYAHHSIGSAIAVKSATYIAVRGMSLRLAAEDFYFLDKCRKVGPVSVVEGAQVLPSARRSDRVIFGTGRFVMDQLNAPKSAFFYAAETFDILRSARLSLLNDDLGQLEELSGKWDFDFVDWFKSRKWPAARANLLKNSAQLKPEQVDGWFDGLETLKLAHEIRDHVLEPLTAEAAMPGLARLLTGATIELETLEDWLSWSRENIA